MGFVPRSLLTMARRPELLDAFFEDWEEFPEHVAIDKRRESYLAYGVSGTPTFVYVGSDGKVGHYSSGYSNKKGLSVMRAIPVFALPE